MTEWEVIDTDYVSIPSSVDPDADPLAPCTQCNQHSRRAYTKGLCVECAETDVTNLICGFRDCSNDAVFRLPDAKPCCPSCGESIVKLVNNNSET